ncbi:MAG: MucBP domain-containing protein [Firmicutes bacterium]|nr:MucBP domain-containing protein [Bacillota bacterium]
MKYVTEDGKVLEGPTNVKKDKPTGEKYTTDLKKFKGYQFVKLEDGSAPANGEVKKGDQHVVYVYREITPDTKTGSVYVEYVTEDGEILEGPTDVKKDAPLGEKYTTEKKAFDGYEFVEMKDDSDPATGTVKAEDQHVIYVYKKKADNKEDEYKVIHEFESGTEGKKLPKEIMDLLPPAQLHKKNGEKVTPTNPSKMKIKTADGTWEFKGYDKADKTIDGADAKFVGKWVFTPNSAKPTDANSKNDGKGTPGKNLGGSTAKGDLSGKNLPKTGDGLDPSFYVMLLLVAGAGLTALGMKERRKMKNKF